MVKMFLHLEVTSCESLKKKQQQPNKEKQTTTTTKPCPKVLLTQCCSEMQWAILMH